MVIAVILGRNTSHPQVNLTLVDSVIVWPVLFYRKFLRRALTTALVVDKAPPSSTGPRLEVFTRFITDVLFIYIDRSAVKPMIWDFWGSSACKVFAVVFAPANSKLYMCLATLLTHAGA